MLNYRNNCKYKTVNKKWDYIIRIIITLDYLHIVYLNLPVNIFKIHHTSAVYKLMHEQWPYYEITFTIVPMPDVCIYRHIVYILNIKQ